MKVPTAAAAFLIANSVAAFLTAAVVGLRVVSRVLAGSKLGWDDYFTLLALPQAIGVLVIQGIWSTAGLGYHLSEVSDNWLYMDCLFLPFETLFATASLTTKLSVLFFYLRVFTSRPMRVATKLTLVVVLIWGIAKILETLLICHIRDGAWHPTSPDICRDHEAAILSTGLFNCVVNSFVMLVPLYTIWSLRKVSVSTRLGLSSVFLLNLIAIIVSIVRLSIMVNVRSLDEVVENLAMTTFLTVHETHLTILCNSLPMLLPLWAFWKHRRFETDEYVSRLGGDSGQSSRRHKRLVEDLTNGIPLETMYGEKIASFTTTVGRGESRRRRRPGTDDEGGDDGSDTGSTAGLPENAEGIRVETKWTISEETTK